MWRVCYCSDSEIFVSGSQTEVADLLGKISTRFVKRFEETANANPSNVVENPDVIATVEAAKSAIKADREMPISSVREIARESGINRQSVHRILKYKLNCKPYKISVMQKLSDTDYQSQIDFVKDFEENFVNKLEFIYGATRRIFMLTEQFILIIPISGPHKFITKPLFRKGLHLDCLLTKDNGSPFRNEDGTINGEKYLHILQDHLVPFLKRHRMCSRSVFRHDGAPPHIDNEVRKFLTQTFGEANIISRMHTHKWPPRSPDLSPVDFCYWGHLKHLVYHIGLPKSEAELMRKIEDAANRISLDNVSSAHSNFLDRLMLVSTG